ncbi:hypothetical protein FIBSPDRAFT_958567 [Athelia psychrophila]|uniref:Uncharacterized protein n=1 Tax=Athelia psychrophila TaxID=1759441 RepID=A0A166EG09_9AGAM|nr:hypothetical protein FIBSPDRAFT_958567 [Fibularhizoctonia sp. CBS 109695]
MIAQGRDTHTETCTLCMTWQGRWCANHADSTDQEDAQLANDIEVVHDTCATMLDELERVDEDEGHICKASLGSQLQRVHAAMRAADSFKEERTIAIAHARNKATFNVSAGFSRQAQAGASTSAAAEESAWSGKRRGAFARDTAAENSQATPKGMTKGQGKGNATKRGIAGARISCRTRARLLRDSRLLSSPKPLTEKYDLVQKTYTQPELLGRALDVEGSILERRNTSPRRRISGGVRASSGRASRGRSWAGSVVRRSYAHHLCIFRL